MKKIIFFLLVIVLMLAIFACDKKKLTIENADQVSIFYGVSSYALFSEMDDVIEEVANCFNDLSFQKSDKEMDFISMFTICFEKDQETIEKISVDKNGVFWLDGSTDCYEIEEGEFDYEKIKSIYNGSKLSYE